MVDVETKTKRETPPDAPAAVWTPEPRPREPPRRRLRVLHFVLTAAAFGGRRRAGLGDVAGRYGSAVDARWHGARLCRDNGAGSRREHQRAQANMQNVEREAKRRES